MSRRRTRCRACSGRAPSPSSAAAECRSRHRQDPCPRLLRPRSVRSIPALDAGRHRLPCQHRRRSAGRPGCRLRRGQARADDRHRRRAGPPRRRRRGRLCLGLCRDRRATAGRCRRISCAAAGGMPLMGPNCYGFVNCHRPRRRCGRTNMAVEPRRARRRHRHPVGQHRHQLHHDPPRPAARRHLRARQPGRHRHRRPCSRRSPTTSASPRSAFTSRACKRSGGVRAPPRSRPATDRKPVIALKTGRSEQGAKVAMSHTSSLAGSDYAL